MDNLFFKINEIVSNDDIVREFRCSTQGGMRRSKKTNTLVLVSNIGEKPYKNIIEEEKSLWWYSGMGKPEDGDQKIEYRQNATLYKSLYQNIGVHLFKRNKKEYTYLGQVLLAGDYKIISDDENPRKIVMFPLIKLGNAKNVTKFLLNFEKQDLINSKILNEDGSFSIDHIDKLIDLMKSKQIDTLVSEGGWFLNIHGFFYNKFFKLEKLKEIDKGDSSELEKLKEIGNDLTTIMQNKDYKKRVFEGQDEYINPYFRYSKFYSNATKHNMITERVIKKDNSKDRNFRVCKLKMKNSFFEDSIVFFDNEEECKNSFYTSMLIGANGTGKSLAISTVQKIFLDIYLIKRSEYPIHTEGLELELEYKIGKNLYVVERKENGFSFKIDGDNVEYLDVDLPGEVISSAFTVQDRFSVLDEKTREIVRNYHYLGFKKDNIENLESFLAANIMNAVESDHSFLVNFKEITSFLEYDRNFKLTFKNKKQEDFNSIFREDFIKTLISNYLSQEQGYLKLEPFDEGKSREVNETLDSYANNLQAKAFGFSVSAKDIEKFYNCNLNNSNSYIKFDKFTNSLELYFDVEDASKYEQMGPEFENIRNLMKLGIFSEIPDIQMKKNGEWLSLSKASSGELQYIFTMINILTKIKDRSLVIIDEPETSLHPNWQYKYMANLREIFKNYPTSHFIFATHSHFMIANLKKESSSLMELKKGINKTLVNTIDGVMFGRSIEDILYDVFNLPSSRNYYIASDIDDVLKALAEEKITEDIREKVKKLNNILEYLTDKDPLKELIRQIGQKVSRYEV